MLAYLLDLLVSLVKFFVRDLGKKHYGFSQIRGTIILVK